MGQVGSGAGRFQKMRERTVVEDDYDMRARDGSEIKERLRGKVFRAGNLGRCLRPAQLGLFPLLFFCSADFSLFTVSIFV
jgi:hypothetical protein